jgi:large subunit ribosomal protein L13
MSLCGLSAYPDVWAPADDADDTTPTSLRERSRPHQLHETEATTVRTYTPKPGEVEATWHVIDATDVVLGRLAAQVATLLRGKHKATFAPHVDGGDFVIVINAEKIALTGNKRADKMAYRHSGYPGGLRAVPYDELIAKHPERVIEKAVRGMLPKTTLGRGQLGKLKVYAGSEHPHAAQKPQPFEITQVAQ